MKRLTLYGIITVATLALATTVYATEDITKPKDDPNVKALDPDTKVKDPNYGPSTAVEPMHESDSEMKTAMAGQPDRNDLMGMQVISATGDQLGEIEYIYPEDKASDIQYVTLAGVGTYGIGKEDQIAVPIEAFNFDDGRAHLTVSVDKLRDAPEQAELSDEQFQQELQEHYGISPEWADKGKEKSMKMKDKEEKMSY